MYKTPGVWLYVTIQTNRFRLRACPYLDGIFGSRPGQGALIAHVPINIDRLCPDRLSDTYRLPVFEARVPADMARRMIPYGFVANASGKARAVESVRSTKEKVANNGKANCAASAKRAG